MGLAVMIVGLALFLGVHTLPAQRELRSRIVSAIGEGSYKLVYALVSLLGIALIAWGFAHYRAAGMIDVWEGLVSRKTLVLLRHITLALMLPAVILVVASYLRGHIYIALKHPMLAARRFRSPAGAMTRSRLLSDLSFISHSPLRSIRS